MKRSLLGFLTLFLLLAPPAYAQGGFSDFLRGLREAGKAMSDLGKALSGNSANSIGVNPADFGVSGEWLDASNAQRLRFPREYSGIGYIVNEVVPSGPAAKTGLQRDDVLIYFGTTPLSQQTSSQWLAQS